VDAVEYDQRCIAVLEELASYYADGRLAVVRKDAQELDYTRLAGDAPVHIVANLPYNIGTQLLINKLATIHARPDMIASMTLMFQREVAQRITAMPDSKSYGRLSVMSQWLCDVRKALDIPAKAFTPKPQVESALVHFVPHNFAQHQPAFLTMEALLRDAFGKRRKMIRSSLKAWRVSLDACNIDTRQRAENVRVDDYVRIARHANGLWCEDKE
jgi:16S rRNA (adenine1518-N6/adenine1519-N6)-dimethyltransferase